MRMKHDKLRLEFQCDVCGLKTYGADNIRSHMEKTHKKEEKTLEKVEKNYEKRLEMKKMKADLGMEKKLREEEEKKRKLKEENESMRRQKEERSKQRKL